jgi:hypothetical protein
MANALVVILTTDCFHSLFCTNGAYGRKKAPLLFAGEGFDQV